MFRIELAHQKQVRHWLRDRDQDKKAYRLRGSSDGCQIRPGQATRRTADSKTELNNKTNGR